ncbi:group II intron reverse transcriptase/maturase [Bacillus sp. Marseille-P3661]|uniref:group II intron reverse transcriptase/maturase n=1 Tax=Bacillus sp. Marseille-P3661 TaxID=1936234 RepID=UPI002155D024|nr:group II intron reverse transcriptase/maturase [Bacillus sp. Marseille-P3661]
MAQKFDYPQTEQGLRNIQDKLYRVTKEELDKGLKPRFKGLIEIMSSDATIVTAIHNIKANRGANTSGADDETMNDILQKNYHQVLDEVKEKFRNYVPLEVRRVWIPKPGKNEERPLGIPAIVDRIIQECVRIVLDPIFEAQFYRHSYGFRPMRDAHMALKRVATVVHRTKHHWIVEGDISKFFDNVNHNVLLKKMWNMGIRDQRVLMMIKAMLKAGIMDEMKGNPLGTPQGGIISPLLANIYLHKLDEWIVREWESKETEIDFANQSGKYRALRKTKLKPAFFIRYADDWVLVTDTKSNAEKWKKRIATYLDTNLKLKLSDEKTLITDCTKRNIKFVGFEMKATVQFREPKGKKDSGADKTRLTLITKTRPERDKFRAKVMEINRSIRRFRRIPDFEKAVHHLNIVNSKIRGLVNYFKVATAFGEEAKKYSSKLQMNGYQHLKRYGAELVKTSDVKNLLEVHSEYHQTIPAVDVGNKTYIGLTNLSFGKWTEPKSKNQDETPYSEAGRALYTKRMERKRPLARADDYFRLEVSKLISRGMKAPKYNFEFYMNRGYIINRDKFKCRVCRSELSLLNAEIHHCSPRLPLDMVNKVEYLASVCTDCHIKIHDGQDYTSNVEKKIWANIIKFRNKLNVTKDEVS